MRRRSFALLLAPFLLAATASWAQQSSQLPWTRVQPADLDRFEANAGNVRVSNVVVERKQGSDAAGPGTEFEFGATAANRGKERVQVYVQIVGVRQDGTPTLVAEDSIGVDPRRNESLRTGFYAPEQALKDTAAFWVHALALP